MIARRAWRLVLVAALALAVRPAPAAAAPPAPDPDALLRQADALAARGQRRDADSLAWRAAERLAQLPPRTGRARLETLAALARDAWPVDSTRQDSVARWAREVAESAEPALAPTAREEAWFGAAVAYDHRDRRDSTRAAFDRALATLRARAGHTPAEEAWLLARIADEHLLFARTADMQRCAAGAIALWNRSPGADSLILGVALVPRARVAAEKGAADSARADLALAHAILRRRLEPDDARLIGLWETTASLRSVYDDPRGAVSAIDEALRIAERSLPAGDFLFFDLESVAASVTGTAGDFVSACRHARRALEAARATRGARSTAAARAQLALANSLRHVGDLASALRNAREAVAVQHDLYPDLNGNRAYGLSVLAAIETDLGDHAGAYEHYRECARVRASLLGPEHMMTVYALGAEATAAMELRRYDDARRILTQVVAVQSKEGPSEHLIESLLALEELALRLGRRDSALAVGERAVAMADSLLGHDTEPAARPRLQRLKVLAALGRRAEALDEACALAALARQQVWRTSAALSEREAMAAEESRAASLSFGIALALEPATPPAQVARVWDELARARELVFRAQVERRARHAAQGATAAAFARVDSARAALARALLRSPALPSPAARARRDSMERAVEDAERAQAALAPAIGPPGGSGLAEALAHLRAGEALVAFARYTVLDSLVWGAGGAPGGHTAYAAFVGDPAGGVRRVALGPAHVIDERVARWNELATRGAHGAAGEAVLARRTREAGEAVRRALWDPVAQLLAGAARVAIVPEGAVTNVDFAALPGARGAPLAETAPLLAQLATEQDLAPRPHDGAGLFALGAPDFEAAGAAPALAAGLRGDVPDSLRLHFEPLPSSGDEARDCAAAWSVAHADAPAARARLGAEASEAAVRRDAPGCAQLHLATHGFIVQGRAVASADLARRGVGAMVEGPATARPPAGAEDWSVSGLALAGANRGPGARPPNDDGYLTGAEIAALDLSRVHCAVLSACRTGATQTDRFESLQGLERAFRLSGVGHVVLSLWPVDDADAREWMRAYYRAFFADGEDAPRAVRAADLERLRALRAHGADPRPARWAPFFVRGEWR